MNFVLVRNCSIFVSVKIYPALCNYSLFREMGGRFRFTREVPSALGPPIDFESRRKSFQMKKKRRKDADDELELEALNGAAAHNSLTNNSKAIEIVVVNG